MGDIGPAGHSQGESVATASQPDLYSELRRFPETGHFALVHQSHQERLDAALSFIQIGLENDERCLYIIETSTRQEIETGLMALGVDVTAAQNRGQLEIAPAEDIYLDGGFDPGLMAESLESFVTDSDADGFAGFRVTGETAWFGREEVPFGRMQEYEQLCESISPDRDFVALCQYDRRELDDSELVDILQTHPKLIYRHRVCDNPYYRDCDGPETNGQGALGADRLLDTAYELAAAQQQIRQREQRVAVLNRVLRHNLRNEMNVIQSHTELLADTVDSESERDSVEAILATTRRLMQIAEDAKRVEKSVGASVTDRVPVDLERVLDRATERAREHNRDIAITLPAEGTRWVEASDELEFALLELFQTLADEADEGAKIVVEFDDTCSTHARQCLRVRCTGANLPKAEIEALTRGEETQLTHGSGLGLWLVNWIVELSGGTLSFERSDGGCEEIVLSFLSAGG